MGLVGESGCGKSVTSYALLGLLSPGLSVRSGRIGWNGADLAHAAEKTLQRVRGHEIAFISQEPTRALDPMFTVELAAVGGGQATARGRFTARPSASRPSCSTDVGIIDIPRVLKSYPHQISGGMAQRVAIALALAGKPSLLVADEPTTALDVTIQAEILDLLRGLIAERGMSIILVTHDLGVVADLCDDVSVMYAGRDRRDRIGARRARAPRASVHDGAAGRRPARDPRSRQHDAGWPRFPARCRCPARGRADAASPSAAGSPRTSACVTVPLEPRAEGEGGVRCVRRDEVRGRQDEWRLPVDDGGDR